MRTVNRSQVSLKFFDEKLYNEFIKPLTDAKELSPLIIKLLGSYYYNDETRKAVDGMSIDNIREQDSYVSDEQKALREKIENVKASAQIFNMCIVDSKSTVEEGIKVVNDMARTTGGSARRDENDSVVPQVNSVGLADMLNVSKDKEEVTPQLPSSELNEVKSDISQLKDSVYLILQTLQKGSYQVPIVNAEIEKQQVHQDYTTQNIASQVPLNEQENESIITQNFGNAEKNMQATSFSENSSTSEDLKSKGHSMLKSLVSSGGVGGFMN